MFHNLNKPLLFTLILLAVFNFFFWQEKLGLNLLIFIAICCAALFILNPSAVEKPRILILFGLTIFASSMVVFNNSVFSQVSSIFCFIILVGYAHQTETKAIMTAIGTSLSSFIIYPYNVLEGIRVTKNKYKVANVIFRYSKLILIPVFVFIIFYSMYAYANPLFNSYSVTFWDEIGNYLKDFFINYPAARFAMLIFGSFLIMGAMYNRNVKSLLLFEKSFIENLELNGEGKTYSRIYPVTGEPRIGFIGKIALTITEGGERRTGAILIAMINFLLLIINIIDIRFTWFYFDSNEVANLAYYVHNGTYMLIFSILLSMAILLFFFRGSVNFYQKNKLIKFLAYLWIFQNAVMAVSVAIRNYHYIEYYYALTYERIGVMIFLSLTFFGLVTMFLKITNKWTLFKLVRINCWAGVGVFIIMSSFNWDVEIAKYNLSNPDKYAVDIEYLLRLSDDALPELYKHKDIFDKPFFTKYRFINDDENGLWALNNKRNDFIKAYDHRTWLSFNYSDADAYYELTTNK